MPLYRPSAAFLAALPAGAAFPLSLAPFDLWPVALVSLAVPCVLLRAQTPSAAFRSGWVWGFGAFGVGVSWVQVSIHDFGLPYYAFSGGLAALFVAVLALFPAFAGWLAARITPPGGPLRRCLAWPAAFVLAEWTRGWILTGFPWAWVGYSQGDGPLAPLAPIAGTLGLSLLLCIAVGVVVEAATRRDRALVVGATGFVALLLGASWLAGKQHWTQPTGQTISVSIIQANVTQSKKWEPEHRQPTLDLYRQLTLPEFGRELIVWPETAVPAFQVEVMDWLRDLHERATASGSALLVGLPYLERSGHAYFNAVVSLGPQPGTYFKRRLVPGGEYLPFEGWLRPWLTFLDIPLSSFSPGPDVQDPIKAGEVILGLSICYEDAFPGEFIRDLPAAGLLVNVSNDAWFGHSLAPHQHLQIARMRALETGRALVRATNTGISALIGPDGRAIALTRQFEEEVLRGEVPVLAGATPYVRMGNLPVAVAVVIMLGLAAGSGRRARRPGASRPPAELAAGAAGPG